MSARRVIAKESPAEAGLKSEVERRVILTAWRRATRIVLRVLVLRILRRLLRVTLTRCRRRLITAGLITLARLHVGLLRALTTLARCRRGLSLRARLATALSARILLS